ncbi:MAG: GNAT family N-acetyltransferase [Candidatus Omnitrophota bacterium]|jgi:CelD/BcsL family acetyltransferase involved in cellulose biosynthesis
MEIIRISNRYNFKELRHLWNQILSESGSDNIFLTWEWMFHWWESFEDKKDELYILTGVKEGKITAIAPLYLHKGYLNELRFLGSGIVCSEYLSFICRRQDAQEFARQVYAYLRKNNRQWNILSLEGTLSGDSSITAIKILARAERMDIHTRNKHRCFYLPLRDKRTAGPQKEKIEYRIRKLSRKGKLGFEQNNGQSYAEVCLKYKTMAALHQKRWKHLQNKNGGLFDNRLFQKFMDKITAVFHEKHWLNISILTLDGKSIAAYYSFTFSGKIYGYLTGFDPAYKNYSPGSVCLWESLLYFEQNGFTEFDFLRGEEEYKRDWSKNYRSIENVIIAQNGIRSFLFIHGIAFLGFFKEIARKTLSPRVFAYIRAIKFKKSR